VYREQVPAGNPKSVIEWFEAGGTLPFGDLEASDALIAQAAKVPGLRALAEGVAMPAGAPAPIVASALDFVLEGLYAERKIGREDDRGYVAGADPSTARQGRRDEHPPESIERQVPGGKKKYYN
jgi:magnesium chelatase subunit I